MPLNGSAALTIYKKAITAKDTDLPTSVFVPEFSASFMRVRGAVF